MQLEECGAMGIEADRSIAGLAARQRGVVSIEQLYDLGLSSGAIRHRVRAGRLHRLHRGVYLVGHEVAPQGAWEMGAVLACGRGSVISHRNAARLCHLPAFSAWVRPVDVTVAGRDPGRKAGIRVHRVAFLDPRDTREIDGIPSTAPARTLLDLSAMLPFHDLERVFADAIARRTVNDREMAEVLRRYPGRRGAKAFRQLIELDHGPTRSEAERKLLALLRAAALPTPEVNARVGRFEVDLLWREQRVIVEVDGRAFHSGDVAFESDRSRDATLIGTGYTVARVTWRQMTARPEAVIAKIAGALAVRSLAS